MVNFGLLLAGGWGKRFENRKPKQFVSLAGNPVLFYSLKVFEESSKIDKYGLVVADSWEEKAVEVYNSSEGKKCEFIVSGGNSRRGSVANGLNKAAEKLSENINRVVVHDTARPAITIELVKKIISRYEESPEKIKGVIPALSLRDTVKRVKKSSPDQVEKTLDRSRLRRIQTPQVFDFSVLHRVHNQWGENIEPTDDAMMVEEDGKEILVCSGLKENHKLTYPRDLQLLEFYLNKRHKGEQ